MIEVRRYGAEMKKSGTSPMYASVSGQWVHWDTYSALAAQRDEGLAREAELHNMLERHDASAQTLHEVIGKLRGERDGLQQRLAEAEKLMTSAIQHWAAAEPGYMSRMMSACMPKLREFLAHPGGADVHKAPATAVNLPRRKVKTEYSTPEEDAQADAWNAALDAVQELNR